MRVCDGRATPLVVVVSENVKARRVLDFLSNVADRVKSALKKKTRTSCPIYDLRFGLQSLRVVLLCSQHTLVSQSQKCKARAIEENDTLTNSDDKTSR